MTLKADKEEIDLFREAMRDVKPLSPQRHVPRARRPPRAPALRAPTSERCSKKAC